jgi:selenocysteine lyase/cysteine desulfurase
MLYGKYDLLDRLPAYKVRPADARPPHKFQTGTQSLENQNGLIGVMEYLEWLADRTGAEYRGPTLRSARAEKLHAAMQVSQVYEQDLCTRLINGVTAIPNLRFFGIHETERAAERVPTIAVRIDGQHPHDTASALGERGFCVWDGNYYAINLTERLGVEESGGMVRIGLSHYNTEQEVDDFVTALAQVARA